ncbi:sigma-70 family RNA polymerase sigma factor [Elusimicrobiota bacterium]
MKIYLQQIHNTADLTPEEREKCFKQIKKGGKRSEKARLKIIQDNLSLVVTLAKKYYYPNMNLEFLDFIEEGNIGLVKAVEKFDATKGFKFSTYASWWIEKHFQDAVLRSRSIVQIPDKTWRYLKKIEQTTTQLLQQTGQTPDINDLSKKIDITMKELRKTLQSAMKIKNIKSLDYYIDDDKTKTLEAVISKEGFLNDEALDDMSKKEQLADLLNHLTAEERTVLELRFALFENPKHTYKEIGDKLKISASKAKEIQDRSIRKLRKLAMLYKSAD